MMKRRQKFGKTPKVKPRNVAHESLYVVEAFRPKVDTSNEKKIYKRNKIVEE